MKTLENPTAVLVSVASVLFVLGVVLVMSSDDKQEMNFSVFVLATSLIFTKLGILINYLDKK